MDRTEAIVIIKLRFRSIRNRFTHSSVNDTRYELIITANTKVDYIFVQLKNIYDIKRFARKTIKIK